MIYLKVVIIMSFDGVFLHKLLPEFSKLKSGRITKIMESGDTDFPEWLSKLLGRSEIQLHLEGAHTMCLTSCKLAIAMITNR